jgi:hypothetical protein
VGEGGGEGPATIHSAFPPHVHAHAHAHAPARKECRCSVVKPATVCCVLGAQVIHRPKGFVHKQRRVRSWLQDVRRTYSRAHTGPGKQCVKTFLLSNADYEHVDSLMSYAYVRAHGTRPQNMQRLGKGGRDG